MIIDINTFNGIKPRLDRFALKKTDAEICENISFSHGGVTPALENVFPANSNNESFPFPKNDSTLSEGGSLSFDLTINKESINALVQVPPSISIYSPRYLRSLSGEQRVFAFFNIIRNLKNSDNEIEFDKKDMLLAFTSASLNGNVTKVTNGYIGKLSTGFISGDFTNMLNLGPYDFVESSKLLSIVNSVRSFDAGGTLAYTSPPVSTGSYELSSPTNQRRVTLSIAGGSQDTHSATFKGSGFAPTADLHADCYVFVKADHEYKFSGSFQYRYGILNDDNDLVFLSNASVVRYMDTGDGVNVSLPIVQRNLSGTSTWVNVPLNRYRIFRSINNGAFSEIDIGDKS